MKNYASHVITINSLRQWKSPAFLFDKVSMLLTPCPPPPFILPSHAISDITLSVIYSES